MTRVTRSRVPSTAPDSVFQTITQPGPSLFPPPAASLLPSELKASAMTGSDPAPKVRTARPDAISQIVTLGRARGAPRDAVASDRPSALHATAVTGPCD